jgi:hypothetical protein
MNVVPAVLIIQNLAIAGHKDGDGIGKKQHPRRDRTGEAVKTLVAHSGVLEFDRIHEMVQSHVSISPSQAREEGRHEAAEGGERVPAESAEQKIEPNDIRLETADGSDQPIHRCGIIEGPAPDYGETFGLGPDLRKLIRENRETKERVSLQLLRDVKSVFAQPSGTGRETCDQTDLH